MLSEFFANPLLLGAAQAAIAALMAVGVMLLARQQQIHIERETLIALARSFVQIVAVGSALLFLFRAPGVAGLLVLAAMIVTAALLSAQRNQDIPRAFLVSFYGIGSGAGVVILLMAWMGVINPELSSLIPVGSMLVYISMISNRLALERFISDMRANVGQIEARLALGARPQQVVVPYAQAAVRASLIPRIDSLRSLGIVWIPGLMAGMVLSGEDPIYAAIYQFVLMAMAFAVCGITSVVSTNLVQHHAFSLAEQLMLRPQDTTSAARK
jgi:putative ABC transport system permease protein